MEHKTPSGLKAGGRKLWRSVTSDYELGEHELSILLEASRTVDALDELERIVREEGVTNVSPQGVRAHPALVEARQQRVTLAKLVASLRIPIEEDEAAPARTPQQRVGVRAVSSIR
ncbi:terminase [Arthrobacter sp. B10-11]|uniref:terminase n=1 Tax=Arthrobacter sp. B10-11 TaxID=3081160 RepID=UPI002953E01A|nr:terminase [Arthrobacter sp. B10-11]MDV8148545.1 terminase [Arthrobacter sp. B10-11]